MYVVCFITLWNKNGLKSPKRKKNIFVVVVNYPALHSRGVSRGRVRAVAVGNL